MDRVARRTWIVWPNATAREVEREAETTSILSDWEAVHKKKWLRFSAKELLCLIPS
jgi:hypothetical protein